MKHEIFIQALKNVGYSFDQTDSYDDLLEMLTHAEMTENQAIELIEDFKQNIRDYQKRILQVKESLDSILNTKNILLDVKHECLRLEYQDLNPDLEIL